MDEESLFSHVASGTREETGASLRAVAAQLSAAGPFTLVSDGEAVTLDPTDELDFEIEVEWSDDEHGDDALELEFEIGWTESAAPDRPQSTDAPQTTDSTDAPGRAETTDETDAPGRAETTDETAGEATDGATEPPTVDLTEVRAPDGDADVVESVGSLATFEVFRDRSEEWRWRLVHRNGNVVATSGEGYTTRRNAEKGLRSVVRNAPGADVVDGL